MKAQTLGLFAILTVGIGLTGFSSTSLFQESSGLDSYDESAGVGGHVTIVHKDAQGNILGYQQSDNIIVNEGLDCMTELTFGTSNSTTCDVTATTYNVIGLVTDESGIVATSTYGSVPLATSGGLDATTATTIGVDVEGDGSGTTQGKVIAALQHTFTKTNATAQTVGGAALINSGQDAFFAAKAFTGGDITLNENDTLEVTWSIQIGS